MSSRRKKQENKDPAVWLLEADERGDNTFKGYASPAKPKSSSSTGSSSLPTPQSNNNNNNNSTITIGADGKQQQVPSSQDGIITDSMQWDSITSVSSTESSPPKPARAAIARERPAPPPEDKALSRMEARKLAQKEKRINAVNDAWREQYPSTKSYASSSSSASRGSSSSKHAKRSSRASKGSRGSRGSRGSVRSSGSRASRRKIKGGSKRKAERPGSTRVKAEATQDLLFDSKYWMINNPDTAGGAASWVSGGSSVKVRIHALHSDAVCRVTLDPVQITRDVLGAEVVVAEGDIWYGRAPDSLPDTWSIGAPWPNARVSWGIYDPTAADMSWPVGMRDRIHEAMAYVESRLRGHLWFNNVSSDKGVQSASRPITVGAGPTKDRHAVPVLMFYPSNSNRTYVGCQLGRQVQPITVAAYAQSGSILHMVCHALGLSHAHNHANRDAVIFINQKVLKKGAEACFVKRDAGIDSGEYDKASIMHPAPGAWSMNPEKNPSMIDASTNAAIAGTLAFGQRKALSKADARALFRIYPYRSVPPTTALSNKDGGGGEGCLVM